ncbi:MAG: insulinase family protein [Verrucomicrobia bacterium]|jgi:predicted Zn-dependent peptidase|nr:insulinase family protein [Verrucomicrobiota bacterium]
MAETSMFENVNETKLANGVRVVTSSVPHVQSVSLGIWVGVGSRHESKPMGGASHFLEHLMFKGSEKRSALDITRAIEGKGGYLNAFTQEESTCYYARVGYDHLRSTLEVLADMVLHPRLDPTDIDKERHVILEEMMMYRDQPHHLVHEMLEAAVWPQHPLGRAIIGTESSVGTMSPEDLRRFKETKYVPANTVVAFAGRVEHAACVEHVTELMASLERGPMPRSVRFTNDTTRTKAVLDAKEIEQTHVAMGFRVFGRLDKRRHALKLLNTILGENMSSRLFQVVRERHGLAYSIHSGCHLYADSGLLTISAGLDHARAEKAVALILKEVDRFRQRPVSGSELRRAKDYVIGQLQLGLESTSNQMMWIGENLLAHGRVMDPEEAISAMQAVGVEDVRKVANTFLRKSRLSIAMVAPNGSAPKTKLLTDFVDGF